MVEAPDEPLANPEKMNLFIKLLRKKDKPQNRIEYLINHIPQGGPPPAYLRHVPKQIGGVPRGSVLRHDIMCPRE